MTVRAVERNAFDSVESNGRYCLTGRRPTTGTRLAASC